MNYRLLAATFLEGLLSFFSPCVLPLIPLYMSYLAGDNKTTDENGNVSYHTGKVFLTTLFFVLGICFTFVLLSFSLTFLSSFLERYTEVISIIGGVLLIMFGLHECGLIRIDLFNKEWKFKMNTSLSKMNFFKAFLFGFVFSLGWSPCIGPMLANAILLASTSSEGLLHLVSYALGLIIPFLLTGLFTNKVLDFIAKKKKIMSYVSLITGMILLVFGVYMIYEGAVKIDTAKQLKNDLSETENKEDVQSYLYHYEFKDIEGNSISLSDYEGEYLLLNFSATWCTYCEMEMPELEEFDKQEDVHCFLVMSPVNEYQGMQDIEDFVKEKKPDIDFLVDEEGLLFYYCGISSYPTSYMISPEGEFICYANGAMSLDGFKAFADYAKGLYEQE